MAVIGDLRSALYFGFIILNFQFLVKCSLHVAINETNVRDEKLKGPIFCGKDGKWKREFERRLKTYDTITLTALGKVRYEVLEYLRNRHDIKIVKLETRYMKRREKGLGLKATVRSYMPTLFKALVTANYPKNEIENVAEMPSSNSRYVKVHHFRRSSDNTRKNKKKLQRL